MPTFGGIVVATGGAPATGRRTFLDITTELARPVDASDSTVLALAADSFRAAVRWMNRKGDWPWEVMDEDISISANEKFSTATGVIKKPLAMHYLESAGGTRSHRISYQKYDVFISRYSMDATTSTDRFRTTYTIPNLFETGQIRWYPTPASAANARFTYYRATPAPRAEQETVEIPEFVTEVYMARAWYEFLKRLPQEQRPSSLAEARNDARLAFNEISAHVNDPGDASRYQDPLGGLG